MRNFLALAAAIGLIVGSSASVLAGPITLINPDMESGPPTVFGSIPNWGPNGGIADHANFAKPNNGSLGLYFGYYSAGSTETVGQLTTEILQPNMTYNFRGWAQGGGDDVGTVPFQIGYADTMGDLTSFIPLATQSYVVGQDWGDLAGVTYVTGAAGPEIGKELIVRLGGAAVGGDSDIWFDSLSASVIPEPASLALMLLGATALLRRRAR